MRSLRAVRLLRREAVLVGVIAVAVFWVSVLATHHSATPDTAYFNELAKAFLHGHLDLADPRATHDLTMYDGRWYVPFPPLPALLMMPFVALVGIGHVNTVLFAAALGGCNAGLMRRLLDRLSGAGIAPLSPGLQRWLTAAYAVGSVHWYMATQGTVWFVAHLAVAVFVLGAANAALGGHPLAAGLLLGTACLGRPTVAMIAPLMAGLALHRARAAGGQATDRWWHTVLKVGAGAGAVASLLLVYNWRRFGSPTEFGYRNENVAPQLAGDLAAFGQFNVHFVAKNVWAMFLAGPRWVAEEWRMVPDGEGMSILLTSPFLVWTAVAPWRERVTRWCWAAVALMLVPLMAYYNTGWYQFGSRFSLDFLPAMMVLLAIGVSAAVARGSGTKLLRALIIVAAGVNLWGMSWFNG